MYKIVGLIIFVGICYIVSLFIIQGKEIDERNKLNRQADINYINEFKANLEKNPSELIKEFAESIGTYFFKPKQNSKKTNITSDDQYPILVEVFEDPNLMEKLNLGFPYIDLEITKKIGFWYCRDDNQFHTYDMERDRNKIVKLDDGYGPKINCETLKNGLIIRKGNHLGGWVILLNNKNCKVLFDGSNGNGFYCARSINSWLASEVLKTKHRWKALSLNDQSISAEMEKVQDFDLLAILSKLDAFEGSNTMYLKHEIEDVEYTPASKHYYQSISTITKNKPAIFLNGNETFKYTKNHIIPRVRLWEGNHFNNVRLSPINYENAVVASKYGKVRVIEIEKDGELLYVDLSESKAFLNFTDWARFLVAKGNLFEQGFEFKY